MSDMNKPSSPEDEYFALEDAEKKRKLAIKVKAETAEKERQRLKELHWMRCPKCGMEMQEVKYGNGVDIDVCFSCNGVFLDKGELELIQQGGEKSSKIVGAVLNWLKPGARAPGT